MKPEEKAKYLFDTFKKATNVEFQEYAGAKYTIIGLGSKKVKELINVTIDEIIKTIPLFASNSSEVREYWQKVKEAVKLI